MAKKIGIIGAGVVGTAIGVVLKDKGYEITGVYDMKSESTQKLVERIACTTYSSPQEVSRSADILFITTSDIAIQGVANQLAENQAFHSGQVVIHVSGSQTSEILDQAKAFGAFVLSLHPLQSFASVDQAIQNIPGSIFSIEGDPEGYDTATLIVTELGGEYFFINREAKSLYHAGACVVSNYLVTVIDFGIKLLESAGIPREQAGRALLPLVQGSVNNVHHVGIPTALTGPIARGDLATVVKHLSSLEGHTDCARLYSLLGYYTADIARNKGTIDEVRMMEFKQLFMSQLG